MEESRAFTVKLDRETHRRLKIAAAKAEIKLTDVVRELLTKWIEEQEKKYPNS